MVEVCGVKYLEGVGKKSNKPYKAFIVHYTVEGVSQGFQGFVTGNAFVNCDLLQGRVIKVGDKIRLNYDQKGFLQGVEFCA